MRRVSAFLRRFRRGVLTIASGGRSSIMIPSKHAAPRRAKKARSARDERREDRPELRLHVLLREPRREAPRVRERHRALLEERKPPRRQGREELLLLEHVVHERDLLLQ